MKIFLFFISFTLLDEIAPLRYVLNIGGDGQRIYSSSPFGIAEFDFYTGKYLRGYILDNEIDVVAPDIYTGYIYFSYGGNLFRFSTSSNFVYSMGMFFNIKSIGITQSEVYIDAGGSLEIIDKFTGVRKPSGKGNVIWFGERRNLKRDSKDIFFLSPYYYYVPNFGKVEYTVFYEEGNKIFAGTWGDGIHIYQKGIYIEENRERIGPATPYITVIKNTNRGVWIGGREYRGYSGLTLKTNDDWIVYKKEEVFGLPEEDIVDIEEMGEKVYFAYPGGISVFERGKFYNLTGSHLSLRECTSLLSDYPNLWVGTDNGIYTIDSETGDILSHFLEGVYINDMEKIEGFIFAGTEKGLFYISPNRKNFMEFKDERDYSLSHILKMGKKDDSLIIASTRGVFIIFEKDGEFETSYILPPPFSPNVMDIKSYKNFIFFGTIDGLYFYDTEKKIWKRENFLKRNFNVAIFSLMVKNDTLWIGSDKGIFLLKI